MEYSFSFFQNCGDCNVLHDTTSGYKKALNDLTAMVPPKFFSDHFTSRLEPSFYMFYHELGYYEYDISPFKKLLFDTNYSNSAFSPINDIHFDDSYLLAINKFISHPQTQGIILIYGENDPYTGAQPEVKSKTCIKLIAKNDCHKSKLSALDDDQKKLVYKHLSDWLKWPVGG